MKRNRRSVKIQDVAKAAGVSVSTVSRVLNNKDDVAEETFERVQAVVTELGYTSSLAARGMRSHSTNLIALVAPDVASTYCHEILRGVNRAISQIDYDLLIYTSGRPWQFNNHDQEVRYVTLLNGSIADAVIVVTPLAQNFNTHAPLVIIDPNDDNPETYSVISTNREGALDAIQYLTGLGHRRIGHITGRLDLASGKQRLQGYKEGLAAAGIPWDETLVVEGDYLPETALLRARELLSIAQPPTAIFAANDMSARGVYQAAQEMNFRIPQDLSVVGFDNLPDSAYYSPPLTTVEQSIESMGFIATELLVRLIRGFAPESKRCVLPTRMVIRESCQKVPQPGG
jgi:LacI family transcriptional regulator